MVLLLLLLSHISHLHINYSHLAIMPTRKSDTLKSSESSRRPMPHDIFVVAESMIRFDLHVMYGRWIDTLYVYFSVCAATASILYS